MDFVTFCWLVSGPGLVVLIAWRLRDSVKRLASRRAYQKLEAEARVAEFLIANGAERVVQKALGGSAPYRGGKVSEPYPEDLVQKTDEELWEEVAFRASKIEEHLKRSKQAMELLHSRDGVFKEITVPATLPVGVPVGSVRMLTQQGWVALEPGGPAIFSHVGTPGARVLEESVNRLTDSLRSALPPLPPPTGLPGPGAKKPQ